MTDKTRKIRLHKRCGDDEAVDTLAQILTEDGYEVDVVDDDPAEEAAEPDPDCDGLVVLVGDEDDVCEDLEAEALQVLSCGGPVVGVWCPGASGSYLPGIIEGLATAVVPCTPAVVVDAVKGRIKTVLKPDGAERPKRRIERVKCQ